jgi:hypothetical protein
MDRNFPFPNELAITLRELRARRWISNANSDILRNRLLAGEAQEVSVELYRKELISSRQFNLIERAIRRDQELENADRVKKPAKQLITNKVVAPSLVGRKAA